MHAIEVSRLSVVRDGQKILSDISFHVAKGSLTVLSGPSGCGKSSILLAIQGLLAQEDGVKISGNIVVGGKAIPQDAKERRVAPASGYLMQNVEAQAINQAAEDELVFGLENLGTSPEIMRKRAAYFSTLFGIRPDSLVSELSGGQKQRLLTAACLCAGNDILLLDEPLANLDALGVEKLLSLLKNCRERGVTVLCVEHRLEAVSQVADRLLWLENSVLSEVSGNAAISVFSKQKAKNVINPLVWNDAPGRELLCVCGLTARRGKTGVFRNVALTLNENTTTLLTGPNGCGKTTLLRLLCGLARYSEFNADTLCFCGKNYHSRLFYRRLRKKVGYVFQNPSHMLFMKSVREEIFVRNRDEHEVDELMELFGITRLADRHPYSLSQGEKRLVSVAAVAASGANLILLDEPMIGQDYANLCRMIDTLHKVQQARKTAFLITTHDRLAVSALGGREIAFSDSAALGGMALILNSDSRYNPCR